MLLFFRLDIRKLSISRLIAPLAKEYSIDRFRTAIGKQIYTCMFILIVSMLESQYVEAVVVP